MRLALPPQDNIIQKEVRKLDRYVGIDVHQEFCHATVQDETGEVVKQGEFANSPKGFEEFFDGFDEAKIAIEAGDAWQPVYDWLDENGLDVKLAHPHKTRIIAEVKIKTDCRDSEALADLVRADLIPEVYVPCEGRRKLRRIAKQRGKLVMERTKFKNRIRAELRKRGIDVEGRSLWTNSGKSWLRELGIDQVTDFLEVIRTLNDRIKRLERKIKNIAGELKEARILMTIPGVSYYSALTIIAEIATIKRFPDSGKLCSYAGLIPSVRQSGSKEIHGSITGGRPLLRYTLTQCALNHVNNAKNSHVNKFYEKLRRKKPKKLALIAAARKLLKVIYWMLKLGEEFLGEGIRPEVPNSHHGVVTPSEFLRNLVHRHVFVELVHHVNPLSQIDVRVCKNCPCQIVESAFAVPAPIPPTARLPRRARERPRNRIEDTVHRPPIEALSALQNISPPKA
ncbi:hypothetical protein AKJ55_00170 [candidate division MSBL1 archaeon SCGC-AAA382M17]|uniref:Transposase IS111A/IS1328/IS1533 N-terminal domain-containing protein n=1 Tax=candidate division MSBL1 archaeon SCGC-AAA382M17 TaxID=1698284 RepID=A0ABR5TK16_9EURY|nr:hypothetical protein AKJ55_00170 [candidate division MSBL1 archaeon SCGC-AAA382M17]